jgi:flagellin FlaB
VSFYTPLVIEYYDAYSANTYSYEETSGKFAVHTVSSNLMVKNIEGVRAKNSYSDMSDTIDLLKLKVGLNVGSAPVDMNNVLISITDGKSTNVLVYAGNRQSGQTMSGFSTSSAVSNVRQLLIGSSNPEKYYTMEKIRDEDASFTQVNPIMNTGDLVTLYIATTSSSSTGYSTVGSLSTPELVSSNLKLTPRTMVNIVLTPGSGAATTAGFVTPSAYGVKETVALYP